MRKKNIHVSIKSIKLFIAEDADLQKHADVIDSFDVTFKQTRFVADLRKQSGMLQN